MTKPLTRAEVEALAEAVGGLVQGVEAGELTAGPAALSFLAGARAALDAVVGRAPFGCPRPTPSAGAMI